MKAVAALTVSLVVAGCAVTGPAEQRSAEQVISERAEVRWQHLIRGDFESAYEYLSPAYRSGHSLRDYRARHKPGLWTGAEVKSVTCREPEICEVEVEVAYQYVARLGRPVAGKRVLRESWRKDAGEWWNVPELR